MLVNATLAVALRPTCTNKPHARGPLIVWLSLSGSRQNNACTWVSVVDALRWFLLDLALRIALHGSR